MTCQRGEERHSAKLRERDVIAIRARSAAGERLTPIADDYPQVSRVAVHYIIKGRNWKHVPMPVHTGTDTTPCPAASAGKETYVSGGAA